MDKQQTKSISLLLLICITGLPQLSETIYTPALPEIVSGLATTDALVQWTLSVYFVGFAVGVFLWGRFADQVGRRPALLLGMGLYTLASLVCFFSHNVYFLLFARFFQAFGVSTGSVVVQTIARDVYSAEERTRVFSVIVGFLAFAPAIGPFIGGIVTQYAEWNFNFLILVIFGTLVFMATYTRLPETHPNLHQNETNSYNTKRIALNMLVDPKVLTFGFLVGFFNGILFSYYSEAPFIFVNKLNLSFSGYGKLGIFLAFSSFFSAMISKRLARTCSAEFIVKSGCALAFSCSALLSLFAAESMIVVQNGIIAIMLIVVPIMGIFASFSLVIPFALSQALENYKDCLGTAGAIFGLFYYCIVSLVTFIMGAIHNGLVITMPFYFMTLTTIMIVICFYYYSSSRETILEK